MGDACCCELQKSAVEWAPRVTSGYRTVTPLTIYPYKQFYRSIIDSTYDWNYLHELWAGRGAAAL